MGLLSLVKDRVCRWLCGDRLFNCNMSIEIDRLRLENEELRELLANQGLDDECRS